MSQESGHAATNNPSSTVILGLDASGDQASVALWRDGVVVDRLVHTARHGHAATLIPMARDLLAAHECAFTALTHIAGGTGPGSFTGIRVALAGAKGLCVATGAKGIGVSVLAAQAFYAAQMGLNEGQPMVILADTRRGSYYGQTFDAVGTASTPIFDSEVEMLAQSIPSDNGNNFADYAVAGAASDAAAAQLGGRVMSLAPADAGQIALLAAHQITHHNPETDGALVPLVPLYLAPAFLGPKKSAE